jgi:hypothetical protein
LWMYLGGKGSCNIQMVVDVCGGSGVIHVIYKWSWMYVVGRGVIISKWFWMYVRFPDVLSAEAAEQLQVSQPETQHT